MVKANTRIDGVKHGSFSVFTLESKRQDGYMMRTFGVTDHKVATNQFVANCLRFWNEYKLLSPSCTRMNI